MAKEIKGNFRKGRGGRDSKRGNKNKGRGGKGRDSDKSGDSVRPEG